MKWNSITAIPLVIYYLYLHVRYMPQTLIHELLLSFRNDIITALSGISREHIERRSELEGVTYLSKVGIRDRGKVMSHANSQRLDIVL